MVTIEPSCIFVLNSARPAKKYSLQSSLLQIEGWKLRSIDTVADPATKDRWQVREIPTVIVLENGREIDRVIGSLESSEFRKRLSVGERVSGGKLPDTEESVPRKKISQPNVPSVGSNFGPNHPMNQGKLASSFGPNHSANSPDVGVRANQRNKSIAIYEQQIRPTLGVNHPYHSKLNRYQGPANIEIAGAPVQGRSGGGLFDRKGRLIGVCIAADTELDEGLFLGPESFYSELEKQGLGYLFA